MVAYKRGKLYRVKIQFWHGLTNSMYREGEVFMFIENRGTRKYPDNYLLDPSGKVLRFLTLEDFFEEV